jgi:hypothetical protein
MNRRFRPAPFDLKTKLLTGLVLVVLIIVAWSSNESAVGIIVAVIIVGLTAVFAVWGYSLTPDAVIVHHIGWAQRWPLAELKSATHEPGATISSIRTFGIGGFFGYIGWFRNETLGSYQAYVTRRQNSVVLRFTNRTIVISPDDPAAFESTADMLLSADH